MAAEALKLFDVNILIYAHRGESPGHEFYRSWLLDVLGSGDPFLYCELTLSAFVRIVTNPRIFRTPTPLDMALGAAGEIRRCENGVSVMPGARHWEIFEGLCRRAGAVGDLVPDAYFAGLAIEARAELVTADHDFERFEPALNLTLLRP